MNTTALLPRLGLLIGACALAPVQAADYCVTSGDQLATALAAADSNDQDDVIKVTLGTKVRTNGGTGTPRWQFVGAASDADNSLDLSGGWTSGCIGQAEGVLTVLDAELDGPALEIVLPTSAIGEFRVSDFGIVRGYAAGSNGASGLRIDASGGGTPVVLAERLFLRNSGASADMTSVVRLQASGGMLHLRNAQISNNTTRNGAALMASVGLGAEIRLSNNTVIDNNDSAPSPNNPVGGASVFGSGAMYLYNNVFWRNTSAWAVDLEVANNFGLLQSNHIGVLAGTPEMQSGRTQGDPQITIAAGGYAMPKLNSPLRNSGNTYVPGGRGNFDVSGEPRVLGTKVDRGALEFDEFFGNGFE
jgi:hypothetical protein